MNPNIPASPADVVTATPLFNAKKAAVIKCANLFKFWNSPFTGASSPYEHMSTLDKIYWFYKNAHPITRPHKNVDMPALFAVSPKDVLLPEGFAAQSAVTMGAAGDVFYAGNLDYSKDMLYEDVADILFDQDIAYANFEAPISNQNPQPDGPIDLEPPTSFSRKSQFDIIKGHKGRTFDILNLSNNHTFDMGVEGMDETHKTLDEHIITAVGTNKSADTYAKPVIVEKNGIKIGIVSATFGLNGVTVPPSESYRIHVAELTANTNTPDLTLLKKQIAACKDAKCDFILGSLHWGFEYEFFPRKQQIDIAHELAEDGVDAIIAHHPHVIQPVEIYKPTRDPHRFVPIAYSLGSMVWTFTAPHIALAAILNLKITKGTLNGAVTTLIESVTATPVFRDYIEENGKLVTRLRKLHGYRDDATRTDLSLMKEYARLVFPYMYR